MYDATSRAVDAHTPGVRTPEQRAWLEEVRRRRWAASWAQGYTPGLPGLPGTPSGSGTLSDDPGGPGDTPGGGSGGGREDQTEDATAIDEAAEPDDGTAQADAAEPEYDQADTADNSGGGTEAAAIAAQAVTKAQVNTSLMSLGTATLLFGLGPLATCWTAYAGAWSQADGFLSCDAAPGVLAMTERTFSGTHGPEILRPSVAHTRIGVAFCLGEAGGSYNGYVAIIEPGVTVWLYIVTAGVWTLLSSVAAPALAAGQQFSLQRNGGAVRVFVNGALAINIINTTYMSGFQGVATDAPGVVTSQFRAY
jgi:hypothetical protein